MIETIAARARDFGERGGVVWKSHHFAHGWRVAVRRERGHPCREVAVPDCGALPTGSGHWTHRKSIARIADCGREQAFKGQGSMTRVQRHPSRDASRHSDRVPPKARHFRFMIERTAREPSGRSSAGVQPVQRAVPDDSECIAAESVGSGLNNGERGRGADRRIDGAAAIDQYLQPGLRGERLTRGDHLVGDCWHPLRSIGEIPAHLGRLSSAFARWETMFRGEFLMRAHLRLQIADNIHA